MRRREIDPSPWRSWLTVPAVVTGALTGAGIWWVSEHVLDQPRPIDSDGPWFWLAVFLAGFVLTLASPRRWWLVILGLIGGQIAYVVISFYMAITDQPPTTLAASPMDIAGASMTPILAGVTASLTRRTCIAWMELRSQRLNG